MNNLKPIVRVAKDQIEDVYVSTVLCPIGFTNEHYVAETMIFIDGDQDKYGLTDQDCERGTHDDAEEQHARWVAKVQAAVSA